MLWKARLIPRRLLSGAPAQRACWPVDWSSLDLQSDSKASIGQPLTVNNASNRSQIAHKRVDDQPFIRISSPLRQNSYSDRAHVFRSRPLNLVRTPRVGYLHWDS